MGGDGGVQGGGCHEADGLAVDEVGIERGGVAEVEVPAVLDGDEDVAAGGESREGERAVGVGLLAGDGLRGADGGCGDEEQKGS